MALATLVIAATLLSCSRQSLEPDASLHVAASISNAALRSGERVNIHVTVTNTSAKTKVISANGCPAWFVIRKGDSVVAPNDQYCFAIAISRTLTPGQSHSITYEWNGGKDPYIGGTEMLSPGAYTLSGHVQVANGFADGAQVNFTILP